MSRMVRTLAGVVGVLAGVVAAGSPVQAQGPFFGGWGWGLNHGAYAQSLANQRTPPYYALFPPVYYSGEIIRRPYGTSPFAAFDGYAGGGIAPRYYGESRTAAHVAPQVPGVLIENPFYHPAVIPSRAGAVPPVESSQPVEETIPAPTPTDRAATPTEPRGQIIHNPYVKSSDRIAKASR